MKDLEIVKAGLDEAARALDALRQEEAMLVNITLAARLMSDALKAQGKILACGNGGSLCDAMHFAEEMTGRFREDRPAYGAIAIADASHMACVGNDYGYEYVFSRYVEGVGRAGDVLLGISTSGSSKNVVRAVEAAKAKGMKVVVLTGKHGSKLESLADVTIVTPGGQYADRVQELHIKCIHLFIELIEKHMQEG